MNIRSLSMTLVPGTTLQMNMWCYPKLVWFSEFLLISCRLDIYRCVKLSLVKYSFHYGKKYTKSISVRVRNCQFSLGMLDIQVFRSCLGAAGHIPGGRLHPEKAIYKRFLTVYNVHHLLWKLLYQKIQNEYTLYFIVCMLIDTKCTSRCSFWRHLISFEYKRLCNISTGIAPSL